MKRNRMCDLLTAVVFLMLGLASPVFAQPPQPGADQGSRGGPGRARADSSAGADCSAS